MAAAAPPSDLRRPIAEEEVRAYERDGAAVLRGVLGPAWIERARAAVERALAAPGPAAVEYTPRGRPGRYHGDFFLWRRDPDLRALALESPLPELAARVMRSREVRFFYDQLLVKEPRTAEQTPWHQDLPYWPLRGSQIVSVWLPLDRATVASGVVVYVRGSHRWGRAFAPVAFGDRSGYGELFRRQGLQPVPDIEAERERYEILAFELDPGDLLIHHPLTLHHAGGNASAAGRRRGIALRYVGDDAVWDARPGTFLEKPELRASLPPIALADGDPLSGELFPRVWPRD